MPPALIALAPVVASGVSQIAKAKSASSAAKKQAEYERQQALAAEAARKAEFEALQNSPAALAQRQKFTFQLGKLLGKAGGKAKIPPSLYNYFQAQRQPQAYVGGPAYTPKPKTGGGVWDVIGGATEALSYLDPSKLRGGAPKAPTTSKYSNIGSSNLGLGAPESPYGSGLPGYSGSFQTGQVANLRNTPTTLSTGHTVTPFNPGYQTGVLPSSNFLGSSYSTPREESGWLDAWSRLTGLPRRG